LTGVATVLGLSTASSGAPTAPTIEQRAAEVRFRLTRGTQSAPADVVNQAVPADPAAAQWGNWGNWGNWLNFANWNNWGNWLNWFNG
jgi:hypothetical protein